MTNEEQAAHISRQLEKGLVAAYEAMLAFKRYKKTPVIISRNGQVLAVSPDEMPPAKPTAA
ncbi:hypothetical protein [Hymenobacter koreensis]|uniref:Prevent-host-death family protein n=1 Tax=Hymenobacter koreensis TaxID=1084523 RepID=A0ABP8IVM3_9BACT